jgi:hypothetical protein
MGWPLRASIEHTDHMLVYAHSKPSSLSSIEAWLKPTTSLAERREIEWGPTDQLAGELGM